MTIISRKNYICSLKRVVDILDEVTKNKKYIVIPDNYQRPYCWGETEIEKLCYEFNEMEDDDNILLGDIAYYVNDDENVIEIIDGQQRLTTLILLNVMLVFLKNDSNEDMLNDIDNHYYLRNTNDFVLKISDDYLDLKNKELIYAISNESISEIIDYEDKNKKINPQWDNYRKGLYYIYKHINVDTFNKNVEQRFYNIELNSTIFKHVLDKSDCIQYFSDKNSYGKVLNGVDIAKTLFSKCTNNFNFTDLKNKICKILPNPRKGESKEEMFFKWSVQTYFCIYKRNSFYMDTKFSITGDNKKLKSIIDSLSKEELNDFVANMVEFLDFINDDLQNSDNILNIMRCKSNFNHYVICFIGKKIIKDIDNFNKFMIRLFFYNKLLKKTSYNVRGEYISITKKIVNDEFVDYSEYLSIDNFNKNDLNRIINNIFYKKGKNEMLKLYLGFIDSHLMSILNERNFFNHFRFLNDKNNNTSLFTIEHIIPQSNTNIINNHNLHSIGNLTLLTHNDNCRLKDNITDKHNVYCQSESSITRSMCINTWSEATKRRFIYFCENNNIDYNLIQNKLNNFDVSFVNERIKLFVSLTYDFLLNE